MTNELLGVSRELAALRDQLARLTGRQAGALRRLPAVLIQGETGVGKGLVAQLLHKHGPRAGAAFVDLNCAAIPETLIEAELFGFERGAFTDARQAKAGLLQIAHRGTIFLDEIGLMPEAIQAKLLKVLEDRTVRRLGSTRHEPVDAWVLAATSEDLSTAIRARRFREDLYHRLAVVSLRLPPLRERGTDILLLARHFLNRACAEYGTGERTFAPEAEAALLAYPWPGNVRELANVMERVAVLSDADRVTAAALGLPPASVPEPRHPNDGPSVDEQLSTVERERIAEALHATGWNISRAATRLGLARNTLRYRMERHGLVEPSSGAARKRRVPEPAVAETAERASASPAMAPVQWSRARVTLVRAEAVSIPGSEHERSQLAEMLAGKAAGFGGRVLELDDEHVFAAFGLAVAEEAPRRAAHAAIAMRHAAVRERPDRPADIRVAIHTAEMTVGRLDDRIEIDADDRRAADATLRHLLAGAPAGGIAISSQTRPFLERRFDIEPVEGAEGAIEAWRLRGLADARRAATPFVARGRELTVLRDLLSRAEDGLGQAVLLAGDPGIGKTRLLQEFRARSPKAAWLQGSAVSYGGALPFHPLIDLLKNACGIEPGDSDAAISEKLARATWGLGDDVDAARPFLRLLLSVDPGDPAVAAVDPKLRRAGIFDGVKEFLLARSRLSPVVVVLEDVHWMDSATREFLPLIIESLASGRILLCATQRTGFAAPGGDAIFGTRLTMARLSALDAAAIACAVLGATSISPDLEQLIDRRTDGNPFFVEEVVRSLHERGLLRRRDDRIELVPGHEETDVPDTVEDVILGRLGRLDAPARELLHVAAVVGREFPRRVLEQVLPGEPPLDERLQTLKAAELVSSGRIWPEVVHTFKHALTQEVAYRAQTESRRRALHARIGDAIERVYADRLPDQFGVLAHHYTRAERWEKALQYLLAAARQAERSFATREALALNEEARHATEQMAGGAGDPAALIAIHEAKARLHFVMSEFKESAAEGERILPLARLIGNRAKEAEALATIAWASTWGRDLDAAVRAAREALAVAEPAGALAVQGRAHFTIGFVRAVTGVLEESRESLEKAVAISSQAGDPVQRSLSLSAAGLLKNWTGAYDEAARLQEEGLVLARERGLLVPLLFSCFFRGLTLTGKGDYDEALTALAEGLSLAERVGDEAIHHRLLNCLGWLYADLGDLDRAEALNTRSAQIGRRRRDPGTQPNAELNLGDIYFARGDYALARELYDGVHRYYTDPSTSEWMRFRYSIRMFASLGELALARHEVAAARGHAADCLELATRTGSRKNLVKAWRLAAAIARADGHPDRAEALLRQALDTAATVGNPVQWWKTEMALADLLAESGRTDEARSSHRRALRLMQEVGNRLRDATLQEAFAGSADVRRVTASVEAETG